MKRSPGAVLRDAGLRPKKTFGQNFLVADGIARAIAEACVHDDEAGRAGVVEIGAGTGALTLLLCERAAQVVAIERDRDLVPLLERELADTCARVFEGDARSVDWAALLASTAAPVRVVCGNLPYALTGPLLRLAVERARVADRFVFMIQDEVADRLLAPPATKEYGALTVFVRAAFDVRRVLRAPPSAFHPAPAVTSAVVELAPLDTPRAVESETLRTLVRCAFQARRKTLRNAWKLAAHEAGALERAAGEARVDLEARGETLDVDAFARMALALDRGAR